LDVAEVLGSLFPEGFTKIIFSSLFLNIRDIRFAVLNNDLS
jgi:hypothetical protein